MTTYHTSCGLSALDKYGGRDSEPPYRDRQWPDQTLQEAPMMLACDLRDGNQSMPAPMSFEQKMQIFLLLVAVGFKEIEVGFPCANQVEYDFVRYLVETPSLVPDDVWLQVLTPCREDAIRRAVECVRGAKRALVFAYLPSSANYRETVLGISEDEWQRRATESTALIRSLTKDGASSVGKTRWRYGFGFEDFGNASVEAVVRCANLVTAAWDPTPDDWMYVGGASSVEVTMPNVFADRVERFSRGLARRDCIRLAIHPHNDRGCATASAELACLAGAQRIEGCLFGNGERAGNLNLANFALNCLVSGLDPTLNFTCLDDIRVRYEEITGLRTDPRMPYAGEYSLRAFSGGHQDAIVKGMRLRGASAASSSHRSGLDFWPQWRIPYLPLDPADIGRSIYSVMGITSQSGKSGVGWAIRTGLELCPPIELTRSLATSVKQRSLDVKRQLTVEETCAYFMEHFQLMDAIQKTAEHSMSHGSGSTNSDDGVFISTHKVRNESAVWSRYAAPLFRNGGAPITDGADLVATYLQVSQPSGTPHWGVGVGLDEEQARWCATYSATLGAQKLRNGTVITE